MCDSERAVARVGAPALLRTARPLLDSRQRRQYERFPRESNNGRVERDEQSRSGVGAA